MSEYDDDLIFNYVMGLDLGEYDVDDLENDPDFMIGVLEYTSDKNMYKLCSKSVKTSAKVMQYMYEKYGDDVDFIKDNVIATFHEESFGDIDSLILTFEYEQLHRIDDSSVRMDLAILTDQELKYLDDLLEKYKDNVSIMEVLQNGFSILEDEFKNYQTKKIILDYFAKVFIRDAFRLETKEGKRDLNIALEESMQEAGFNINRFIVEYISDYDTNLGEYVSENLNVINPVKTSIKNFILNKPEYDEQVEVDTFELIDEKVKRYMRDEENNMTCPMTFVLYYIGGELGITDLIAKYEVIELEEDDEFIFANIYQDELEERNGKHHKNIKSIMEDCLEETGYRPTHKVPKGFERIAKFGRNNSIELTEPKDFSI